MEILLNYSESSGDSSNDLVFFNIKNLGYFTKIKVVNKHPESFLPEGIILIDFFELLQFSEME